MTIAQQIKKSHDQRTVNGAGWFDTMEALIKGIKMALYSNWINNWIDIDALDENGVRFRQFAEHHGFTLEQATQVIDQGKIIFCSMLIQNVELEL